MWLREQVLKTGELPMMPPSETTIPFTSKKLAEILKDHGYETHPKGMAQPFATDFEYSPDGKNAFLDVNADAVRKSGEVPDRPIRLTFESAGEYGGVPRWRLKSVAELPPTVTSKALDRQSGTPKKDAHWPN